MTNKQPVAHTADETALRKELAAEEKAIRKAQSMELLRALGTKLTSAQKTKAEATKKEETLKGIREEIFEAFSTGDNAALDTLSVKLNNLGY